MFHSTLLNYYHFWPFQFPLEASLGVMRLHNRKLGKDFKLRVIYAKKTGSQSGHIFQYWTNRLGFKPGFFSVTS